MNNYNNPYNQYQYENSPRNPYYNQNNQPYYQVNSYNNHKRPRHQWYNKNQWCQNSYPNHFPASSGPQRGQIVNPPSIVPKVEWNECYRYEEYEDVQFEPQTNWSNRGTTRNHIGGGTQRKEFPKRVQNITKKQSFVPSLLENEMTNESTSETKDEVVKAAQALFAEEHKHILTQPTRYNSRQINLLEAFSKPVESNKAERMMQIMGWKGGALGSSGQGITEPLMPNIFQKRSAGFGVPEPKQERKLQTNLNQPRVSKPTREKRIKNKNIQLKPKQKQKVKNKPNYTTPNADTLQPTNSHIIVLNPKMTNIITKGFKRKYIKMRNRMIKIQEQQQRQQQKQRNPKKRGRKADDDFKVQILNQIFHFVSDESRTAMAFDKDLTKFQRKTVHDLVSSIKENNDDCIMNYDSLYMVDLMHGIMGVAGGCELFTESIGQFPDRQLHLYKSMPEHVYLITEDDLRIPDYVDDCILINDDDDEVEEPNKANDETDDHKIEPNINNGKIPTEGVNDKDEVTIKHTSDETNSCNDSVKSDILNDVQSQQSINKGNKETSTQSANVEDAETIKKPTESIKRGLSNDMTVDLNISIGEQENNSKVIEETAQNKEIVTTPNQKIRETLIEFFKEFFNNETYKEMRFSGDFNELETDEIDTFMTHVELCIGNVNNCQCVWDSEDNLQDIFQNESYKLNIKVNPNFNVLIQKVPRNSKNSEDKLSDSDNDSD